MSNCPICLTEYFEELVCTTCGYDLTPYPLSLNRIPEAYLEKERLKLEWGKEMWRLLQEKDLHSRMEWLNIENHELKEQSTLLKEELLKQQIDYESTITEKACQLENLKTYNQELQETIEKLSVQVLLEAKTSKIELVSVKEIDYSELEKLLRNKQWREANELTENLLLKSAALTSQGYLDMQEIEFLPSEDLRTIDRLWIYYSDGKFGFSVQKELWLQCGGKIYEWNYEVWKEFGEKVGWYDSSNDQWLTYSQFMKNTENGQNALSKSIPCIFGGVWMGWAVITKPEDMYGKNSEYIWLYFTNDKQRESCTRITEVIIDTYIKPHLAQALLSRQDL